MARKPEFQPAVQEYRSGMCFIAKGEAKREYAIQSVGKKVVTIIRQFDGQEMSVEPQALARMIGQIL